MQHIDWVLWMVFAPLMAFVSDYLATKIKQMKGKDLTKEQTKKQKSDEERASSTLFLIYIVIAVALW